MPRPGLVRCRSPKIEVRSSLDWRKTVVSPTRLLVGKPGWIRRLRQRDTWHPLHDTDRVIGDIDREAKRLQKAALKLEKQLTTRGWTDTVFVEWSSLTERSDTLRQQAARLRFWGDCLQDSVKIVDLRSGEIRDFAINAWIRRF